MPWLCKQCCSEPWGACSFELFSQGISLIMGFLSHMLFVFFFMINDLLKFIFNWSIYALQYCKAVLEGESSVCVCRYVPLFEPHPIADPPGPTSAGHHTAPPWASLCGTAASQRLSLHTGVCVKITSQFVPRLLSSCALKSILCFRLCFYLITGSPVPLVLDSMYMLM